MWDDGERRRRSGVGEHGALLGEALVAGARGERGRRLAASLAWGLLGRNHLTIVPLVVGDHGGDLAIRRGGRGELLVERHPGCLEEP